MGSDYYMNPPKWFGPRYRSKWVGNRLVIEQLPGQYDTPATKWQVAFDEELSVRETELVVKAMTVFGFTPPDRLFF